MPDARSRRSANASAGYGIQKQDPSVQPLALRAPFLRILPFVFLRSTMKLTLIATAILSLSVAVQANAATYVIDPDHTSVTYETTHFGTSTLRGRFDDKAGKVEFDRAARTGKVDITFQTASVSTGVAALDTHLKSKEFFDSATYPTARFVGDRFTFNGDKVATVSGTLTLLGKSFPVTLTASRFNCYDSPILKREVCGGDFTTSIKRSQWGISYGLNYGFSDQIPLLISVEAIKQ
jgi:polyisoprenoid-binding protein YceI